MTVFDVELGRRMRRRPPRIGCLCILLAFIAVFACFSWLSFQPGSAVSGSGSSVVDTEGLAGVLLFAGFPAVACAVYLYLTWRLVLYVRSALRAGGTARGVVVVCVVVYLLVTLGSGWPFAVIWMLLAPMAIPAFGSLAAWVIGMARGEGDPNERMANALRDEDLS